MVKTTLCSTRCEKLPNPCRLREKFSQDLAITFPNNSGFSARNLSYMRKFYNEYSQHPKLLDIAKEVSWRTNIVIMTKISNSEARLFYLKMAADSMCNRDVISAQISSKAFERGFLQDKKHNFNNAILNFYFLWLYKQFELKRRIALLFINKYAHCMSQYFPRYATC